MLARNLWMAVVLTVLSCAARGAAQEAEGDKLREEEVVKVDVDLVTVNVSVTDGGRRPVTGLQAADFLFSNEGRAVGLDFFEGQGPASLNSGGRPSAAPTSAPTRGG